MNRLPGRTASADRSTITKERTPRGRFRAAEYGRRAYRAWRMLFAGLQVPTIVVYAASTLFSLLAFNQGDLSHTVGSSYAYLNGHVLDFYDYNKQYFGLNDYYPTVYVIFAAWMAPVKLLVSAGEQNGALLSSWEVAWAKLGLLLIFWASVHVLSLIAKELFPSSPTRQTLVRLTYLLSPFAAFAFNVIGQYDVLGVLFTLLGVLFYLRGDAWRFALFFALAASCKYFALAIFAPLLLLKYKKPSQIITLGATSVAVIGIQAAIYFPNAAFRNQTLFGLAGGKLSGDPQRAALSTFVLVIIAVGLYFLWRYTPTAATLGPVAVFAASLTYGLLFEMVAWNPQWFMVLTPFFALSVGYLRRPGRFLAWESIAFFAFIWYVVELLPKNIDSTMFLQGPLRRFLGSPNLLLSDLVPASTMSAMSAAVVFFLVSPAIFYAFDRFTAPDHTRAPWRHIWWTRAATLPIVFTIPSVIALATPMATALRVNPAAETNQMIAEARCRLADATYGELSGTTEAIQSFSVNRNDFAAVSIQLGTYGRKLNGTVDLTLLNPAGDTIGAQSFDLGATPDNSHVYLVLDSPAGPGEYKLAVRTSRVEPGAGIALWGSATDCFAAGALTFNGVEQPGDLNLGVFYTRK